MYHYLRGLDFSIFSGLTMWMYAHNYTWISLVHSEVELERKTIPTNEELFIPFNGEHTKMFVIDQDDEPPVWKET